MMTRYDVYKDSGVEWIGEFPEQWDVIKSKFLFGCRNERNNITEPLLSVTQKDSVVRRDELATRVWNPDSDISAYKLVKNGDFVISLRTFEGGIELSNVQGLVSPAYTVLYRKKEIEALYYKYLLKSARFITELNKITTGIRQGKNISFEDFAEILLPVPGLMEQKIIGTQLDAKTSLIDQLIDVKQRKIELLKEKRTALINHVVTKGLDPNVKMKESGVEWIGVIPEHWDVKKMKYGVYSSTLKANPSSDAIKISPENVESGTGICLNYYSEYEGEGFPFIKGDILFNKLRIYLKKILFADFDGFSMGEMIVLRCNTSLCNRYLYYLLFNQGLIDLLDSQSTGIKMPRVSPEIILNSKVIYPPISEQTQIVEFLNEKTKEIDNLLTLEQKKIDLLKEYRQSLISEVVTGKIKVTKD